MMRPRSYSELRLLPTLTERFDYLKLGNGVGDRTFGGERYLNQKFYTSRAWRDTRNEIIIRDQGCDMGVLDFPISDRILIHHINPITVQDIEERAECLFDPNNLVSVRHLTHNAIHYGDDKWINDRMFKARQKGDTKLW